MKLKADDRAIIYKLLPKTPAPVVNAMQLRPVEKLAEAGVAL